MAEVRATGIGGFLHVYEFYTRKQKRVTRSTFAAEIKALYDGIEFGRLLVFAFQEIVLEPRAAAQLKLDDEQGKLVLPLEPVVDAQIVFDSLAKVGAKTPAE